MYIIGILLVLPISIYSFLKLWESKYYNKFFVIFFPFSLGLVSVLLEKYYCLLDYWQPIYIFPHFYIEDILYGLSIGWITMYVTSIQSKEVHVLFTKEQRMLHILVNIIVIVGLFMLLHINSIYIQILICIIIGILNTLRFNKVGRKILKKQIKGGFIFLVVTSVVYAFWVSLDSSFSNMFYFDAILSFEEFIFAFCAGFGLTYALDTIDVI